MKCEMCPQAATTTVVLRSKRTGRESLRRLVCDEHRDAEARLATSGLSMVEVEFLPVEAEGSVTTMTDEERTVLRRLLAEIVQLRDTTAEMPPSEQNDQTYTHLANASTVVSQFLEEGWLGDENPEAN